MLNDAEKNGKKRILIQDPFLQKLAVLFAATLSLALLLFSLIFSVLFVYKFTNPFMHVEDFKTTNGTIAESGVKVYASKSTRYNYYFVAYTYDVDGTTYQRHRYSNRYNGVPTGFGADGDEIQHQEQIDPLAREYAPGNHVLVYYPKPDPSGGELRISTPSDFALILGILAAMNVLVLYQFAVVLRFALTHRYTRPSDQAPSSQGRP